MRRITDGFSTFSHQSQDEWEPESWVDIFEPVAAYFHKILLSSRHLKSDPEVIGCARNLINLAQQWAESEAAPQVPPYGERPLLMQVSTAAVYCPPRS